MISAKTALRETILGMSRNDKLRAALEKAPGSRGVVARFIPGDNLAAGVAAAQELDRSGRMTTIDYLGEDTADAAQAAATRDTYLNLLRALSDAGLTEGGRHEVSVKLSAVGQFLPQDGEKIALENTYEICAAARNAGTTVTLDMEAHTTVDSTLGILRELRRDFPTVGAVLQSSLYRTEADCRDLATEGSRIRLCKGAYAEPASVAYQQKHDVDLSYVRCLRILMEGQGYPMVATHDPRMLEIGAALAAKANRKVDTYEFQMLYGIRVDEQKRIVDGGEQCRIYLPHGDQWYGYLMRRMAERPANAAFFLRALTTRGEGRTGGR